MILVYVLFALTGSTVLTALFTGHTTHHRQGHAFMFFFIAFLLLAGVVAAWLAPAVASGQRSVFYPVVFLALFGAILAVSVILSIRSPLPAMKAVAHSDTRLDAEAAAFDFLIWLSVLASGIAVLKAAGI